MDYIVSFVIIFVLMLVGATVTLAGRNEILKHYKTGKPIPYGGTLSSARIKIPKKIRTRNLKMRGVWVATVGNIDFARHKKASDFKREYLDVIRNLRKNNFTAIMYQIRPTNDAFYRSKLNPWSKYLSGKEGQGIKGFDPLDFMLKETHKRGIEYHAWLNPYRVTHSTNLRKAAYLKTLDPNNFARLHPEFVLEIPRGKGQYQLILDPGQPEVRKFIINTIKEIIENYKVDAIHFDDYFYPYVGVGDLDKATFESHNPEKMNIDDWRRYNVNTVIKDIKQCIDDCEKKQHRKIHFGISPFGIWANKKSKPEGSLTKGSQSYFTQFADTRLWIKKGWIDYIVPQIYWSFDHEVAAYAALVDWWADTVKNTKTDLYIGQAASRLGSIKGWKSPDELYNQMRYNSKNKNVKGTVFFSYSSLFKPRNNTMKKGSAKVLKVLGRIR